MMKSNNLFSTKFWVLVAMAAVAIIFSLSTLIGLIVGAFKFVLFTFIDIMVAIFKVFFGMIGTADNAFGDYIGGPLGPMGYIVLAVLIGVPLYKYFKKSQTNNNADLK